MDGYGIRDSSNGNAIKAANTFNIDKLLNEYPNILLDASGEPVGLPEGQMGNSEVGHMNIGAGRVVYQSLTLINKAVKDGSFYKNEKLLKAIDYVKENNSKLHLFTLFSDGGVHSHIDHLYASLILAKKEGLSDVMIHLFGDGRDTDVHGFLGYYRSLEEKIKEIGIGTIASVSGRYFAMDRDKNIDRTYKAYKAMVDLEGNSFDNAYEYVKSEYETLKNNGFDSSDEFITPAYNKALDKGISDNDSIIFLNFRPDRAIQMSTLITNPYFYQDKLVPETILKNIHYTCMMKYADSVHGQIAFKLDELSNILGEYLSNTGHSQLRIAETEKYAHVTFFFDGTKNYDGVEREALEGADRILVNSPKVATYDLKPEMSAYEVCDRLIKAIESEKYDVIIVNFANCDMVGHTAVWDSIVKAVEAVDECVGKLYEANKKVGGVLLLTADHGNADIVYEEDGTLVTSRTTSPVPFVITDKNVEFIKNKGKLADIAPTLLTLMEYGVPDEMDGEVLIKEK
jgi:2,3-bisphosphoglycerate-independent phosphoglycerate mutase